MISIPIAANIPTHYHQLSLFWANHKDVYGNAAKDKAHAAIVLQEPNHPDWQLGIPNTIVKDCHSYHKLPKEGGIVPLNIQIALQQILHQFNDTDILELLDCDMFHLRPAPDYNPGEKEFFINDIYEDWHLKSLTDNKHIIQPYLKNDTGYLGGFVPIIGQTQTFKIILEDWIQTHISIYKAHPNNHLTRWWAGMYSFQTACANNNIKMTAKNNCYIPNVNNLEDHHYITHYCCDDKHFNKKIALQNINSVNIENLPDNLFYNKIKEYIVSLK